MPKMEFNMPEMEFCMPKTELVLKFIYTVCLLPSVHLYCIFVLYIYNEEKSR